MAKFTDSRESKAAWNRIAQRWLRCAELMDKQDSQTLWGRKAARQARSSA